MESLYLLIPLSVVLVFLIGVAFWWSVKSGQFDDMEGPAYRVLMDDDRPPVEVAAEQQTAAPKPKFDD
jgi:cbb3-type cytochrome oxidase maturation protein